MNKNANLLNNANRGAGQVHANPVAITLFFLFLLAATIGTIVMGSRGVRAEVVIVYFFALFLIGFYLLFAVKVASQWEKAVVLRLGKFHGLFGPGLFWVIPVIDGISNWIDHRVMVTPF